MQAHFSSNGMRAIDILKAGYSMETRRRVLAMPNGGTLEFFCTPVTLDQRTRAKKEAKTDESADFAISLLILKARDENGMPLFTVADAIELRRMLPAAATEELIDLLMSNDLAEDEVEVLVQTTPKPSRSSSVKTDS